MATPCECEQCFYCDMPLAPAGRTAERGSHEHDHWPWPKRQGGTLTVPACWNCHSLKDRTPLAEWNVSDLLGAFRSLPPMGRLLLAKIFMLYGDKV